MPPSLELELERRELASRPLFPPRPRRTPTLLASSCPLCVEIKAFDLKPRRIEHAPRLSSPVALSFSLAFVLQFSPSSFSLSISTLFFSSKQPAAPSLPAPLPAAPASSSRKCKSERRIEREREKQRKLSLFFLRRGHRALYRHPFLFLVVVSSQPRPSLRQPPPPLHHSASSGGPYSWLRKDPLVLAIGFLGWTVPAASPSPSFGGGSLFGGLLSETSAGLAQFPTPPSIDSPFWIYLITCVLESFLFLLHSRERKREREEREKRKEKGLFSLSLFRSPKKNRKFPKKPPPPPPPPTTDHVGLFVCLTLAQIGVQGRKQGYF